MKKKLTDQNIKKAIAAYDEIEELVGELGKQKYRADREARGIKTHHGSASGVEWFNINDGIVSVTLDTSCCGSADMDTVNFPLRELVAALNKKPSVQDNLTGKL